MSETTIEWTATVHNGVVYPGYTLNPWIGCQKVSPGCQHCYAETLMDHRYGKVKWGPLGTRLRTSVANWRKPVQWNKQAEQTGIRRRVFCASLADVFEDRPELVEWRMELFQLIDQTPNLDWLLLTKRPENVNRMIADYAGDCEWLCWDGTNPRTNIWIGTSVENQEQADKRIPELLRVPAAVRFLSMEPLLGKVALDNGQVSYLTCASTHQCAAQDCTCPPYHGIDWVIAGGESGPQARPMQAEWALDIRRQCEESSTAFFMKQMGTAWAKANRAKSSKGADPAEWPAELRVRTWPVVSPERL